MPPEKTPQVPQPHRSTSLSRYGAYQLICLCLLTAAFLVMQMPVLLPSFAGSAEPGIVGEKFAWSRHRPFVVPVGDEEDDYIAPDDESAPLSAQEGLGSAADEGDGSLPDESDADEDSPEAAAQETAAFEAALAQESSGREGTDESSDDDVDGDDGAADVSSDADLQWPERRKSFAPQRRWPVRVLLYAGPGASTTSVDNINYMLRRCVTPGVVTLQKTASVTNRATRARNDVVLFPGGRSGDMVRAHGTRQDSMALKAQLSGFLHDGGGFVGICGGAFVATRTHVAAWDVRGMELGVGALEGVRLDNDAVPLLPMPMSNATKELNRRRFFYANGPFFVPMRSSRRAARPFAHSPQRIAFLDNSTGHADIVGRDKRKHTNRRVAGRGVVVHNGYLEGKVVLSTAHPETELRGAVQATARLRRAPCGSSQTKMLMNMILTAANRTRAQYVRRLRRVRRKK